MLCKKIVLKGISGSLVAVFLLIFAGLVVGQKAPVVEPDLYGRVVGSVYINDFFGFEMKLPETWTSIEQEESEAVVNMTSEVAKARNVTANKTIDRGVSLSTVLLLRAKEPVGSIENASIGITAAKQPSKFITSKMVLETTKSAYLKNEKTKLIKDYRIETYGGKEFAAIDFELESMGNRIPVKFLVVMVNGYSLTFSLSSLTDEDWNPITDAMSSIKFIQKINTPKR